MEYVKYGAVNSKMYWKNIQKEEKDSNQNLQGILH
jgi:hypothetical protein